MGTQSRGGLVAVLIIFVAVFSAAGNVAVFLQGAEGVLSLEVLARALGQCVWCVAVLAGGPIAAGTVLAVWAVRSARPAVPTGAPVPAPATPATDTALRLLALLQQEGRLVDFLEEDIAAYGDAQVGAAVRSIHAGCRKVLREHVQLAKVIDQEDGVSVELAAGFDPAAVRVTGNVAGAPPFRGTLQHAGWRVAKITLPKTAGDSAVIAPAEVEVA
ncbi:MAG: DUF2760 domain-containing protein [Deltaproteobacteria bacterium]|nr:DUF2760 domain-containing protein [Deltaproteobacteria bacterium]